MNSFTEQGNTRKICINVTSASSADVQRTGLDFERYPQSIVNNYRIVIIKNKNEIKQQIRVTVGFEDVDTQLRRTRTGFPIFEALLPGLKI